MKKLLLLLLIAPVLGFGQVTFDSEKTFLSEYKDIARFVSTNDNDWRGIMIAFGNYDKSSTLFPTKFFALGDCFNCTEGWKIYVNELKCEDDRLVCKIIINKPNVFVEKCQLCESADNTIYDIEYSVSGDILTVIEKITSEDGKYVISKDFYRRDDTIKCCTKREIEEWEKNNIIIEDI